VLLKSLSPPAVELELRLLITLHLQSKFLRALTRRLRSHKDFEMVQTLLAVFLKLHGESMIENMEMREGLEELLLVMKSENTKLRSLVMKNLGMLSFIREIG
jgi:U3 small nucleolar RNA-associated protein 21